MQRMRAKHHLLEAVDEAFEMGERAGIMNKLVTTRLRVKNWGKVKDSLAKVDAAVVMGHR